MAGKNKSKPLAWLITAVIAIAVVIIAVIMGIDSYEKVQLDYKKSTHPLMYSEYVEKYSAEYGLDKYIIYSVIKTESSFDPEAVSSVGARGLMQIMEETFDWIKFRLGDGDEVTYDDMFDPEMNIRYGAYLYDYLLSYFGHEDLASAAYNSGIGTVSGWLENEEYSDDGETLKVIPTGTAAHYVNKINNAYSTYYELYVLNERN